MDIVFPGRLEKIHISIIGPPEDPFDNLHFTDENRYRLGLSLMDLRLKANAGCDFSQYLKDEIEYKMHRDANPDAVQLYTRLTDFHGMIIDPLICLQSLHYQDNILEGRDVSRCFVTAGSAGGSLYICCILSDTSGKSLAD